MSKRENESYVCLMVCFLSFMLQLGFVPSPAVALYAEMYSNNLKNEEFSNTDFLGYLDIYPYTYTFTVMERKRIFEELIAREMLFLSDKERSWVYHQAIYSNQFWEWQIDYEKVLENISSIARHLKKPAEFGKLEEHFWKNLHHTAIPYDATRTLRTKKDFYISASDVFTPEQMYIVAQAPLEETVIDFWTTILETNTSTIVALAMPEDTSGKYARYWDKKRFPLVIQEWTIDLQEEKNSARSSSDLKQNLVERTFFAFNKDGQTRTIIQIHYENWPDFGAPALDLFQELLLKTAEGSTNPIFVHCAAGQGRSGTFVTADSILKEVRKIPQGEIFSINIPKRIIELRSQRKGLVTTTAQLEAVFRAIGFAVPTSRSSCAW